ncbi:MAG TPA: SRPBCC family protein [Actinomycetes bacterium]
MHVALGVIVDAPPEALWAAVTDWERQSEWMLGTRVRVVAGPAEGVGARLEAFTGVGRAGFVDSMVVTEWDPPWRATVLHTGRVVRGTGLFEVLALPGGRSRFVWSEDLELPLGLVGRLGFPVVRPVFLAGVRASLARLAAAVESAVSAGSADSADPLTRGSAE